MVCADNDVMPDSDLSKTDMLASIAGNVEEDTPQTTPQNEYQKDEEWVCHHPGTHMHNQPCIDEQYPDGCYIRGDNGAFCWLLMRPESEDPDKYPEVQKVCHLLRR